LDLLAHVLALTGAGGDCTDFVCDHGGLHFAGVGVPGDDAELGLRVVGEGKGGVFCGWEEGVSVGGW